LDHSVGTATAALRITVTVYLTFLRVNAGPQSQIYVACRCWRSFVRRTLSFPCYISKTT